MFDPPQDSVAYAQTPYSLNNCPEHGRVALQAARETLVLLKNDGNLLPLKKDTIKNVAVVGPAPPASRCCWATATACPTGR